MTNTKEFLYNNWVDGLEAGVSQNTPTIFMLNIHVYEAKSLHSCELVFPFYLTLVHTYWHPLPKWVCFLPFIV
jgi:hypothetical protein